MAKDPIALILSLGLAIVLLYVFWGTLHGLAIVFSFIGWVSDLSIPNVLKEWIIENTLRALLSALVIIGGIVSGWVLYIKRRQ
jgi:hypothetical protein